MPNREKTYEIVEAGSTASNLGWFRLGSPMTPFIGLLFRRSNSWIIFPSKENRVYIDSAQFDVIDSEGASSASIVLSDPDFVTLERLFLRAIWEATSGRNDELWYLKVFWGWQYYGGVVRNKSEDPAAQNKSSGYHYYMLRDLKYDIDDVELRVSFDLIDISQKVMDPDEHGPSVGIISGLAEDLSRELEVAKELQARRQRSVSTARPGEAVEVEGLEEAAAQQYQNERAAAQAASQPEEIDETDTEEGEQPVINNVFWKAGSSYTHWEVIQKILESHGIRYRTVVDPLQESNKEPIIVSAKDSLYGAIRNLLKNVPPRINKGSDGSEFRELYDIMPGTWVEQDGLGGIIFGYKPVQPAAEQKVAILENYPLVRTWIYRPSYKQSLAVGVSTVKSFSFSWDSQGPWGPVAPKLYAVLKKPDGTYKIYYTKTELEEDRERGRTQGELKVFEKKPEVGGVDLEEAARQLDGVEIKFNFEQRNKSSEEIELKANTFIINMWNFFLSYIIEVDIEIFGDPWLDNTMILTTENAAKRGDKITRLLVNLFQSRFKILVYRADGQLSTMLSGDYMCFQGCSHRISEGEYSTSLKLLKIVDNPNLGRG
jgi:hypothetical protein